MNEEIGYKKFKQQIIELKDNTQDEDSRDESAHALIKEIASVSMSKSLLTRLQTQMKKKLGIPKGDFHGLLSDYRREIEEALKEDAMLEMHKNLKTTNPSWSDIIDTYRKTTSTTTDLIEIVLATLISVRITTVHKLPLIWLIIAGAPSSDKTTQAVSPSKAPQIHVIDKITGAGLASGFVDPTTGKKAEKDYLKTLHNEALIIKDMASCFNMHPQTVRGLIGDLTNMYDGQFKKITGTVGEVGGDSLFSLIACTTIASLSDHHIYMAKLGPRFFTYSLPQCTKEQQEVGLDIIWKGGQGALKEVFGLKVSAYFYHLFTLPDSEIRSLTISDEFKDEIKVMSDFLCRIRSYASKTSVRDEAVDGTTDSYFETQREEPFRAFQQIRCYLLSFALVNRRKQVTEHDLAMLRKILLSSGPTDRTEILRLFGPKTPTLSISDCADKIKKSYNSASAIIDEMIEIGILEKSGLAKGSLVSQVGGRYQPVEQFRKLVIGDSGGIS